MQKKNRIIIVFGLLMTILAFEVKTAYSWGFWAHKRLNRMAVFTLPPEMIGFYKIHLEYVTENSVNPDKRRYASPDEYPRHYIDIDYYGEYPFEDLPRDYNEAVEKYSLDTVLTYGTIPWHIADVMRWLTSAFENQDEERILRLATDLGHYIGDAHVPLHTTLNYNGQYTNQRGIHGFWESRLPELFADGYNYFVGRAEYIEDIEEEAWSIVLNAHLKVDSVLDMERDLHENFPEHRKYSYERRGQTTVRVYSEEYSKAYHEALNGMVERQMRKTIKSIGDFWYTAWVNAGQPDINIIKSRELSEEEQKRIEEERDAIQRGAPYGRPHPSTGQDALD